jgi:hypothetical protein
MGKIWVALVAIIFAGCTATVDNHNISMTFYKVGELQVYNLAPDDEFIEETAQNDEIIYKDKLERWEHVKPDKVIIDYGDGEMVIKDGATGNLMWVYKNSYGVSEKTDYYKHQNDISKSLCITKKPISDQAFQIIGQESDLKEYEHPKRYTCKLVNNTIPRVPENIKNQYATNDPFFINFATLDEGWAKYEKLTNNDITYGHDVVSTFFSDKYKTDFAYKVYSDDKGLFRYENIDPEPESYWVERKVGTFKPFHYQAKPCKEMPVLRSSHFKDDVLSFVEKTLKPTWVEYRNNDEVALSSRSIIESARITMIPMSKKIWMILVGSQNGLEDPNIDKIWTFAVVEFDSKKPLIRAFGQPTKTDTGTWTSMGLTSINEKWADPDYGIQLYGVADVNLDGFKDFILGYTGMGSATVESYKILVISLTETGFCEIVPDNWIKGFFGLDNGKPLFRLGGYGHGQLYTTLTNEGQVSLRWKTRMLMIVEPRKDGCLYMVSYKYHNFIEDLIDNINQKKIHYLSLGNYDLIGKTKRSQKAFLETVEYSTDEQKEIVKILLSKHKPMFVSSNQELLVELEDNDPFKQH